MSSGVDRAVWILVDPTAEARPASPPTREAPPSPATSCPAEDTSEAPQKPVLVDEEQVRR